MLDGLLLVDAHVHAPRLPTLRPAWIEWAEEFGRAHPWPDLYDADGTPVPERMDAHFEGEGVDAALLFAEYSPKATGEQPIEDLLPMTKHNPRRFRAIANVNPHLHHPIADEVARQVGLGAVALKLHPVHAGFDPGDTALYPAYQACRELGIPVILHCGTSGFPGSTHRWADPALLDPVLRDFPDVAMVLAHGGRGWWYDAAPFLALSRENVWIELSGLPPSKLATYYAKFDLARLARRFIFGTDWPGMPGVARNARAIAKLGWDDETVAGVWALNALRVFPALADLRCSHDLRRELTVAIYALGDREPSIDPTAYVHPDATVIGDVRLGPESSVWPGAVLRADYGFIEIGARTSVQDGSVLHTTEELPTTIGADCVVGHLVHAEGCLVEDGCLVGSGSILLNRCHIGTGSVVGAGALVPEDYVVPPGYLALGVPAKARPLPDPEAMAGWIRTAVQMYTDNAARYAEELRRLD